MWRRLTITVSLFAAGCAPQRAWHYEAGVVQPPVQVGKPFRLKNIRTASVKTAACEFNNKDASLTWKGRDAVLRIRATQPQSTQVSIQSAGNSGAPAQLGGDVLAQTWFDAFDENLKRQTDAGCLTLEEVSNLRRQVVDHAPLATRTAYRKAYGEFERAGYIDLFEGFRLRCVEPVRENGEVAGYLTAFYELEPVKGGLRATAGASETNLRGIITKGQAPDHPVLHLPPDATRLRLFFRSWNVSGDRRIALLAASSLEQLERSTAAFEADPEHFCATPGANCVAVKNEAVLGAELRIATNNGPAYAQVGGSLGEMFRDLKVRKPEELVLKLKIERPFEGKLLPLEFDSRSDGILGYVPIGGERIAW